MCDNSFLNTVQDARHNIRFEFSFRFYLLVYFIHFEVKVSGSLIIVFLPFYVFIICYHFILFKFYYLT
ncbi:hypothetical protein HanIR_Chr11g0544171 [Helianthus annuus]|nr:hypothetical protein HanIR_Chr11g0544171 [Helianthus annuus]